MGMSGFLDGYVKGVEEQKLPVEAIVVYQHGERIAAHRWTPDEPVNIYSHTKSFMCTAIGIAIDEGLLSLDDAPVDVLKSQLPENVTPGTERIRLRHLLTMSSGFGKALLMGAQRHAPGAPEDYIAYMFTQPMLYEPGARFDYSSADSYLAGCMLEARASMTLRDYLDARIFKPLGIAYPEWEHCPHGHTFGGGGMWTTTDSMAKLGLLYLQRGAWEGRQLVPEKWVEAATSLKIDTNHSYRWDCGYGYQFWLDPIPGAYRADGMYCQITHVLPDKDAVVSYNCHATDAAPIHELFYSEVYAKL